MPAIIAIVEGDGEVQAVPILIRRIAEVATPGFFRTFIRFLESSNGVKVVRPDGSGDVVVQLLHS